MKDERSRKAVEAAIKYGERKITKEKLQKYFNFILTFRAEPHPFGITHPLRGLDFMALILVAHYGARCWKELPSSTSPG